MRVKAKKRFGQNFLIDNNIIDSIVNTADINEDDTVIEIGPGTGNLTRKLLECAGQVIAVEIDRDLTSLLEENLGANEKFSLIGDDIMKVPLSEITDKASSSNIKFVANLPYYITTPILLRVLESDVEYKSVTVMVQKEVALRMVAEAGSSDYGALSVAVDYYTDANIAINVPRGCFRPIPNVDSAVVHLIKKSPMLSIEDKNRLFKVVKAAFGQRRKTLVNALSGAGIGEKEDIKRHLAMLSLDANIRGEKLSLEDFIELSKML